MHNEIMKHITVFFMLTVITAWSIPTAKSEDMYPREQVEKHLRAMFPDMSYDDSYPPFVQLMGRKMTGFDFLALKKQIRFNVSDLKQNEIKRTIAALEELFNEVLDVDAVGVDPIDGDEFDLFILVSDDLAVSGQYQVYKYFLKGSNETDEEFIEGLGWGEPGEGQMTMRRLFRSENDPFVIIAAEREDPSLAKGRTFEMLIYYLLMHGMTGAKESNIIQPSVVNVPGHKDQPVSFTPIDRAVLRAIFSHKDWSDMNHKTSIKYLIDRVMEQLTASQ